MRGDHDRRRAAASTAEVIAPARRIGLARAAAPLAWAGAALVASRIPALTSALPGLAVLQGPLGIGLAALGLAIFLARRAPPGWAEAADDWAGARSHAFALTAAFLLYAVVGLWYATRLRVSGDEPHYLLMAQSLWREGDLDLRDNDARQDWREYTPGPIGAHYGAPRQDGRPFPAHSPGLPLLLAPVYAAGGRLACVVFLAAAAAGVTAVARALARRLGAGPDAATVAWLAALGPPVLFYSFHVYTEVASALALCGALGLIGAGASAPAALLAGLAAGMLPWLHVKMIAAAGAVGVAAAAWLPGRRLAAFTAAAGLMALGYVAHLEHVFGRPTPLAIYGGAPSQMSGRPAFALAGLFLDRSFGLLFHAPVFLLALAGAIPLARRWREAWPWLLAAAAVLAPALWWRMWWGGQSPPGRFLVPLVPVLAAAVALRVAESPRGLARWRWPLAAIGLALASFAVARPGALLLLNRGDRPTRLWTALSGDVPLERYLPSLVAGTPEEWRVAALWLAVITAVLVCDRLAIRRDVFDRGFRSLGFPLVTLLALTLLVDCWAR
jgi:hypothetical protein